MIHICSRTPKPNSWLLVIYGWLEGRVGVRKTVLGSNPKITTGVKRHSSFRSDHQLLFAKENKTFDSISNVKLL
jgi:hypothetical protein